ncbi:MAG: phage holin family protein [Clostridia bacterium]|nr:phage holin family protein [Clostridia bacterium]
MHTLKNALCAGAGVVFSAMAQMFGGWDAALGTLIAFMAVDYVTGFLAAAVFHKSRKTEDGTLESRAGWKGLCRKGVSLAAVLVACRLDLLMGSDFIRDAVVIGFAANEALSILENAGLMGVPLPGVIVSAVHVLRDSSERAAEKVEESDADAGRKEGGE